MAKFNVIVDHEDRRDQVVDRLKSLADRFQEEMTVDISVLEEEWDESGNLAFAFKAMGFKITGTVVTCESSVTVMGQIPFAALPFRGALESQIREKVIEAIS